MIFFLCMYLHAKLFDGDFSMECIKAKQFAMVRDHFRLETGAYSMGKKVSLWLDTDGG